MKKNILVFLFSLIPFVSQAEVVTAAQAETAAARFFAGGKSRSSRSAVLPLRLVSGSQSKSHRGGAEQPAFYVFNRGDNQGFVIIAGDDAARPVLAYAHKGHFSMDAMPENLRGWMQSKEKEISALREQQAEPTAAVKEAWQTLAEGRAVVNLNTPLWNQTQPYNSKCPSFPGYDGWHAYTGCTITATAIVMGHHQWPDGGVGVLKGYNCKGLGVWVDGVNLNEYQYRWEKMPEINGNILPYDENSAEYKDQEDAISTLMRDLGIMLRADYDYDGTSAPLDLVAYRLPLYMKYSSNMFHAERKYFTDKGWHGLLKYEIDHQRPIAYAGYGKGGGHSFVLDGYDNGNRFYVNWGWGGTSNGFYDLDAMDPYHQGAGGTADGYSLDQEAILRISPLREGSALEPIEYITFTETMYVGKGLQFSNPQQKVAQGETAEVTAGRYCNLGSEPYKGTFQLVITNAQGDIKKVIYTTPERDFVPGAGTMPLYELGDKFQFTFEDPIAAGDRIRLVYLSRDGQWKPVVSEDENAQWEIVLKADEPAPAPIAMQTTAAMNLGERAVATFSAAVATIPSIDGVEAFYAVEKDNETILLKKVETGNGPLVVPANTGVVLATRQAAQFTMTPTTETAVTVSASNLLQPTNSEGVTVAPEKKAFILGKQDGDILFHILSSDHRTIAPNRAYLLMPEHFNTQSLRMFFDEVTGVENVRWEDDAQAPVYDLSGRRVQQVQKGGLYIRNGKKFIVK